MVQFALVLTMENFISIFLHILKNFHDCSPKKCFLMLMPSDRPWSFNNKDILDIFIMYIAVLYKKQKYKAYFFL